MKRKKLTAILVLIIILLLGVFLYKNISIENNKEDEYQDYTPEEEISEEQARQAKIVLYFENTGNGELESEVRVIDANSLINNPEKEIMNLLIKGPQSSNLKKLIPEGTVVHEK